MIPVLYEENENDFTTMGIGALPDCVAVTVKRVLNGQDELTLTYPDNGIRVHDLQNSRIIYAQPEYKKSPQPYVIYAISKPVRGLVTVYARHIKERASFIPVMPFTASSLAETLAKIPDYCAETNPFTFWTDKSVTANFKLESPASLGNVLGGMEGSILDTFGGEYEFDGYTVKLWNRRGVDRGVTLRYGKNVTDATQEESIDSTITGICPFWTDSEGALVTLPEKVVHSQNAQNFPFNRTVAKDFSETFEEQPTVAQLRAAAQAYVARAGVGVPKVSLSVSFEHLAQYEEFKNRALLETVNLGDTVTVIFERLDVNATARVVQTEYDVLKEKYRKIAIGAVRSNLNSTIKEAVIDVSKESNEALKTALERSIDRATQMITGANGGYLVDIFDANGQRTGDMIMDTNDPATATNVWLRNLAGWGYSSTGVNGQYRTAITQDGHIVADFIDTGVLTANIVRAGVLTSPENTANYWNLDTGELRISAMTGTNLLPPVYYREDKSDAPAGSDHPYTYNGVTWTLNEDGTVTATGKAVGGGSSYSFCGGVKTAAVPPVKLDPGKKYTVSGCPPGSDSGSKFRINARFYPEGVDPDGTNNGTNYEDTGEGVTAPEGFEYVMVYATVYENTELPEGGITFKPMLNPGDKALDYVPTHDRIGTLYGRLTAAEASISVNSSNIELKVSATDFTGETIVGKINLDANTAVINAKHISLAGKTIDLTGDIITIDSTKFKVDSEGVITATKGKIGGWTIDTNMIGAETTDADNNVFQPRLYAPNTTTPETVAFYIKKTAPNNTVTYPFRVRYNGHLTSTDADIGGWTVNSTTLYKRTTIDNKTFEAGIWAPQNPTENSQAFYVQNKSDSKYPFEVRYDGSLMATKGNIAGWEINDTWLGKEGTLNNKPFFAYVQAPQNPSSNSAFLCLRTGASGSYEYPFIVRYDGSVKVTNGTFTGTITGSTINSTVDKKYEYGNYSNTDATTISNLILSGRYPTATQLTKYDFNHDGEIDIFDLAIVQNMINNSVNYVGRTKTVISHTNTNVPIQISYGGATEGEDITLSSGTAIGTQYVKTESLFAADSTTIRSAMTKDGIKLYDSSRYLRVGLDLNNLYFKNTSGKTLAAYDTDKVSYYNTSDKELARYSTGGITFKDSSGNETASYSNYRASGEVFSWSVAANSTATKTISFGKTFPASPFVWVQLTQTADRTMYGNVNLSVTNITTTGFTVRAFNNNSSSVGMPFMWMTF